MSPANVASELARQWTDGNVSYVLTELEDMSRAESVAVAVYILHFLDNPEDSAPAARFMRTLAALC